MPIMSQKLGPIILNLIVYQGFLSSCVRRPLGIYKYIIYITMLLIYYNIFSRQTVALEGSDSIYEYVLFMLRAQAKSKWTQVRNN